ncbi:hypothetical protein DJ90_2785 [Paenibacillus macerans]|uniref:Uncharacterized protein n=1 Tax=Paenibacillus macerans TaxID=44252 RepID=A0A090YLU6_PAEMA|nr:hypothetical protein DJ90_2785 [Paenibacillus macerans]
MRRNQLRRLVDFAKRHVQRPAHIANGGAGRHRPERNDLGHVLGPVFACHIGDHLVAALVAEIDIDIRHRHPLGIQKPFKQQVILDRVDIGDAQHVSNQAACRRSPARAGNDPAVVSEGNEIPNDEKIIGKSHLADHFQLITQPLLKPFPIRFVLPHVQMAVALLQPFFAQLSQIALRGQPFRNRAVSRQNMAAEFQLKLAALGYFYRVGQRLGHMREQRGHLIPGFQVELVRVHFEPVFVVDRFAGADANEHILNLGVLPVQVMHIVGGRQFDPRLLRQLNKLEVYLFLLRQTVILQLQIKISAKRRLIAQRRFFRFLVRSAQQMMRHLSAQTGAQADQPFPMPLQRLPIDPRFVVEAFQMADRDEFHQIPVPGFIFSQQNQMVDRLILTAPPLLARACRKINFTADDRLDPVSFAQFIKRNRAVHDTVIRQRERLHAGSRRFGDELFQSGRAVEQAVFAMYVQMNEAVHAIPSFSLSNSINILSYIAQARP